MIIERFPVGIYAANCYVVADENRKECIVVDPGGSPEKIINYININKYKTVAVVLTHGHVDHIAEANTMRDKLNAPIMIHKNDGYMTEDSKSNLSKATLYNEVMFKADNLLKDKDVIAFGDIEAKVIHTPGHTRGGITLQVEDMLITGDTLFQNSYGRTDLEGGNLNALYNSIIHVLFKMDEELKVLPGHGGPSSIGYEKKFNPMNSVRL